MVYMVQEKYDTWRLPCSFWRDRIATGSSLALFRLFATDCADGRHPLAVFLDRGHPWPSAAAELRANFLFCLSGARLVFWFIAAGAECGVVLRERAPGDGGFCLDASLSRIVALAFAPASSTCRICRRSNNVWFQRCEEVVAAGSVRSSLRPYPLCLRGSAFAFWRGL